MRRETPPGRPTTHPGGITDPTKVKVMSHNERVITARSDQIWDVLSDGWLYPTWVVGASRMREVEGNWPAVGSRLHHSVGSWPMLVSDHTEVLACEPERLLKLHARGFPMGAAEVTVTLTPEGPDTRVVIEEMPTHGPAVLIPKPAVSPLLHWRNTETLRRLAYIAEHRDDT